MKFLNIDSPLMQGLGKMADLMWLNILALLCCLPIVTVGASLTALNYMALKIVRNEECYVTKDFFKSFKLNFKQSTLIWLIFLVVFLIFTGDFFIIRDAELEMSGVILTLIMVAAFLVLFTFMFVFPVQAKFENTVFKTIKNAFLMSVMQFPKTIAMIVLYAVPAILFCTVVQLMPVCFLFGLSFPAWVSAKMYNKFFERLEKQILEAQNPSEEETEEDIEDTRVFKDELESVLADQNSSK